MIAMRVAHEYGVNRAEPRIRAARDGRAWIEEYPDPGRIFEDQSPIRRTEFACTRADRCNLHVLGRKHSGHKPDQNRNQTDTHASIRTRKFRAGNEKLQGKRFLCLIPHTRPGLPCPREEQRYLPPIRAWRYMRVSGKEAFVGPG